MRGAASVHGKRIPSIAQALPLTLNMADGRYPTVMTIPTQSRAALLWLSAFLLPGLLCAAGNPMHLDLRNGSIGTVSVADNPAQFNAKLGAADVQAYTGHSEGERYRGYKLKFADGEVVDAVPNFLAIDSPGFRTPEGLGVGSTWQDFRDAYPDGEFSWSGEGFAIWSEKYKFRLYFEGNEPPKPTDRVMEIQVNRVGVEWW